MFLFWGIYGLIHFLKVFCIIIFVVCLAAGSINSAEDDKKEIISYVTDNEDTIIGACDEALSTKSLDTDIDENFEGIIDTDIISDIEVYTDAGVVIFEGGAEGLLTSTFTWGFYYSADDTVYKYAVGWAPCSGEPETNEEGTSWKWISAGDDYYYVEKICDKFYYYNAGN